MEKQFVTYKIALKLKDLGFDEPCFGVYLPMKPWMMEGNHHNPEPHFHGINWCSTDNKFYFKYVPNHFGDRECIFKNVFDETKGGYKNIAVPLWQQVIDWLRVEKDLIISIIPFKDHQSDVNDKYIFEWRIHYKGYYGNHSDYNKARKNAILKAIELCKKL